MEWCLSRRSLSPNAELVHKMSRCGTIRSSTVEAAFLAVDRAHFISDDADVSSGAYADMPLRCSGVHLSAPSIYAAALEALDLRPGLSFLNIGSGAGYLSAIASQILGSEAIHHGVEHNAWLVEHARSRLAKVGCSHVELHAASVFSIDLARSMRYARIYIGAGASVGTTAGMLALLQVGGVLVGPLGWPDGSQQLIRATRTSESSYAISPALAVQFTRIVQPPPNSPPPERKLTLRLPRWDETSHRRFPPAHRAAVRAVLILQARSAGVFSYLPKEVVVSEVLPLLRYDAWAEQHSPAGEYQAGERGGERWRYGKQHSPAGEHQG